MAEITKPPIKTNQSLSRDDATSILTGLGVPVCAKPVPPPVITGTIGPAPEPDLIDRIRSAHMSSYTRMQWIEKMADATIGHAVRETVDTVARGARSLLPTASDGSAVADRSLAIDGMAQLAGTLTYFASLDFPIPGIRDGRPGDRQAGAYVEANVQRFLENKGRPDVKGVDDIVMASGWKFDSGEIKVNGKIIKPTPENPLEITNMLAVFVKTRGENGKPDTIEILDPSTKVEGLKQLPKLALAMASPDLRRADLAILKASEKMPLADFLRIGKKPDFDALEKEIQAADNPSDKRWRELVGASGYIGWQIIPAILSGGSAGVAKGVAATATKLPMLAEKGTKLAQGVAVASAMAEGSAVTTAVGNTAAAVSRGLTAVAPKLPVLAMNAEKISAFGKGLATAATPLALTNTVGGMAAMGGQFGQSLYFSPKAIDKLADKIAGLVEHPGSITAQSARDALNSGLFDKTFDKGSNAGQNYIKSLGKDDSPWKLMGEALGGNISLYNRKTPWDKWPSSPRMVEVPEIKQQLANDPRIAYAFNSAFAKHMSGKKLTDEEVFVMRVGYKISNQGLEPMEPAGKASTETKLNYTAEERTETFQRVQEQVQARMIARVSESLGAGATPDIIAKSGPQGLVLTKAQNDKLFADTGLRMKNITIDFLMGPQFSKDDVKAFLKHDTGVYEEAQRVEMEQRFNQSYQPYAFGA